MSHRSSATSSPPIIGAIFGKPYERFAKKPEEDAGPSDEERRHQELLAALQARG